MYQTQKKYLFNNNDILNTLRVPPAEKGRRLIINDAICVPIRNKFRTEAEFNSYLGIDPSITHLVNSDNKSWDYHDTMNSECWLEWFEFKLLPKVLSDSIIHIDRATYHLEIMPETKWPTKSDLKHVQQDWLLRNNIPFEARDTKAILYQKILDNKHNFPQKLRVNDILERHMLANNKERI